MLKTEIESLIPDIYNLFQKDTDLRDELFVQLGRNVEGLMKARLSPVEDRKPTLRMSNIGRPDRQLWYDINGEAGAKETLSPSTLIKFLYGDMIEQMVITLAKQAGYEVADEQAEVNLDGIVGHIDFRIGDCVVDVKSASSFSFAKFETGSLLYPGNDPFGYVAQLSGYVEALKPSGVKRGAFLAVDKTLGKLCLLIIPEEVQESFDVKSRIVHIRGVVGSDDVPPRCYGDVADGKSGNYKLDTGCSYCPHKFTCWADANNGEGLKTYYYSNGPRYLTVVKKEPRVSFEDA